MKGLCLMGETQGNYVDPRAAKSVLEVLRQYLKLDIKLDDLDKKAKETEEMISRFEQIQKSQQEPIPKMPKDESSTYIR
jgi:proteasome assembly chaperone (PAC2) family protein